MAEYEEVEGAVEVPKNSGVEGFLKAIKAVLKLPRIQGIDIDAKGKVSYKHFVRAGERYSPTLDISFDELMPYAIIRNSLVVELPKPHDNAAIAIHQLFDMSARDLLHPEAVVVGANTQLWEWYKRTTDISPVSQEELCGVPLLRDRMLEDHVVVLCAGYVRGGELTDTQKSYKLSIPQV